jgi:uncharacterized protein YoxC
MLSLINILILFFILLISYQIFLAYYKSSIMEGMTDSEKTTTSINGFPSNLTVNETPSNLTINQVYRQYDKKIADNTFLMAQQNAGNIEYLKQRIDSVQGMYKEVQDLSSNVQNLQDQVNGLVTAQQQYASQLTGGSAPNVTGATSDGTEDVSNLVT